MPVKARKLKPRKMRKLSKDHRAQLQVGSMVLYHYLRPCFINIYYSEGNH